MQDAWGNHTTYSHQTFTCRVYMLFSWASSCSYRSISGHAPCPHHKTVFSRIPLRQYTVLQSQQWICVEEWLLCLYRRWDQCSDMLPLTLTFPIFTYGGCLIALSLETFLPRNPLCHEHPGHPYYRTAIYSIFIIFCLQVLLECCTFCASLRGESIRSSLTKIPLYKFMDKNPVWLNWRFWNFFPFMHWSNSAFRTVWIIKKRPGNAQLSQTLHFSYWVKYPLGRTLVCLQEPLSRRGSGG